MATTPMQRSAWQICSSASRATYNSHMLREELMLFPLMERGDHSSSDETHRTVCENEHDVEAGIWQNSST